MTILAARWERGSCLSEEAAQGHCDVAVDTEAEDDANCSADKHSQNDCDAEGAAQAAEASAPVVSWRSAAQQPRRAANLGSLGHPLFCQKPCLFFGRGECERDIECSFCHRCPALSDLKLNSDNKKAVREMDSISLEVILATFVKDKLDKLGAVSGCARSVQEWREAFGEALSKQELRSLKFPGIKLSRSRRLFYALDQMNLHALCGVALTAQKDSSVAKATKSLLGALRLAEMAASD